MNVVQWCVHSSLFFWEQCIWRCSCLWFTVSVSQTHATEWLCKELHGQPDPIEQQKMGHNFQSHFSSLAISKSFFFSWAIQRVRAAVIVAVEKSITCENIWHPVLERTHFCKRGHEYCVCYLNLFLKMILSAVHQYDFKVLQGHKK